MTTEGRPARLVDYVQHKSSCDIYGPKRGIGTAHGTCTCGLAALVAASGAPPQDIREQDRLREEK